MILNKIEWLESGDDLELVILWKYDVLLKFVLCVYIFVCVLDIIYFFRLYIIKIFYFR